MARILVVDDSSIMRRNLSAILKKAGHTIIAEAANGELGYKEYEKHKPDLVTMDITMPVMDGIAAVKKIIQIDPEASIIMISALDQKFMVLSAIQCGAKHYIIKPFTPEKVIHVVDEVLKTSSKPVAPLEAPARRPDVQTPSMDGAIGSINNAINELNNTIDALGGSEPPIDEEADDPNAMPFTVENKNGILLISIGKSIDESHFTSLGMVVQGFLFIKPLKLVLNFGNAKTFSDELFTKVAELIKPVKAADGSVKIAARNEEFLRLAEDKALEASTVLYKSLEELYS